MSYGFFLEIEVSRPYVYRSLLWMLRSSTRHTRIRDGGYASCLIVKQSQRKAVREDVRQHSNNSELTWPRLAFLPTYSFLDGKSSRKFHPLIDHKTHLEGTESYGYVRDDSYSIWVTLWHMVVSLLSMVRSISRRGKSHIYINSQIFHVHWLHPRNNTCFIYFKIMMAAICCVLVLPVK